MNGQLSIFDCFPDMQREQNVGDYIEEHGNAIPHNERHGFVGKKICFPCGTQSMPDLMRVGILERYFFNVFDHCWRSVIYTGQKQRTLINHEPWKGIQNEIFELRRTDGNER